MRGNKRRPPSDGWGQRLDDSDDELPSRIDFAFESSCAVLELVDYDALDASSVSTAMVIDKQQQHLGVATPPVATRVSTLPLIATAVNLFTRRRIGLLVSVLFAGFFTSALKRAALPLMKSDLNLSSDQGTAIEVLLLMPWSYSFLLGFLSDVFPILGSRRRAYMMLAWCVSLLALFAVALLNYVEEYDLQVASTTASRANSPEAQGRDTVITVYAFLLMLASFGAILSIVIAEVHVVALSRGEALEQRGSAVGTLLLTQYLGDCTGQIVADKVIFRITAFGVTPLVSFRSGALGLMFLALVPLVALLFAFRDREADNPLDESSLQVVREREGCLKRVRRQVAMHWRLVRQSLERQSTTNVVRFLMVFIFFTEFELTFPFKTLANWCGVDLKTESSANIIQKVMYLCAVAVWKVGGLNFDWRRALAISFLCVMAVPQLLYMMIATFSVSSRSASAYAIIDALQGFLRAAIVVVEIATAVEIAPPGGEGAIVGSIVSIGTIMRLLAATFSNALGYLVNDDDQADDTSLVAFALALCFAIRLLALLGLLLLPGQKLELQRLHLRGQRARRNALCTIGIFAGAFVVAIVFNWMAVAPATACLRLVGGEGCT